MKYENIKIEVDLDATRWNNQAPTAKVYIDHELIFDASVTEPVTVHWSGDLPEGSHVLAIEMHGKTLEDTVETDDKSGILKDMLLHIKQIRFDNINLNMIPWEQGVFQADSSNPYAPENTVRGVMDIGWNGRWQLSFTTPSYIWLIENL